MQKITTNQYILIASFCILTSKIMTMPTIVYGYAKNDAIFSVAINILIDFLIVVLITNLIKKYPNKTFLSLLTQKFKKVGAILITTIISIFLVFKAAFLLQETLSFFTLALYENFNIWLLLIPAILTILYISYKGLNAIGRSIDIYWIFVFLAVVIILVISISKVNFNANLPYFENGLIPVLKGSMHSLLYTGNGLLLFYFLGKVELKPKIVRYTTIFSLIMTCVVVLNVLVFYDLFTTFVPYCTFALSHLSQSNPFVTELGHVGWLSIVESTINLVFMCSICCFCVRQYLQNTFKIGKKIISTCITGLLFFLIMYLFKFDLYNILNFVKEYGFWYNAFLLPIIIVMCIILCIVHKNRQHTAVFEVGK